MPIQKHSNLKKGLFSFLVESHAWAIHDPKLHNYSELPLKRYKLS